MRMRISFKPVRSELNEPNVKMIYRKQITLGGTVGTL